MKNNLVDITIEKNIDQDRAILQEIRLPNNKTSIKIYLKREDLLHPIISGNKWRKLKYNIYEAINGNFNTLLTFGGAYSNHIHATSYAGKLFGLNTIGVIRGEEHFPLNPTLTDAKNFGMKFHYLSRSDYRKKKEPSIINNLQNLYGDFYLIPEGGSNSLAVKGCVEIVDDINIAFDYILSACGTGGTIAGIITALRGKKKVIGIPVLKGASFLYNDIESLIYNFGHTKFNNWHLELDYHHGGYAKISKELINFILKFERINNISLDPIYTGKLMFAINDMIQNNYFPKGSSIIALHTGGLQGKKGMENKINKLLS